MWISAAFALQVIRAYDALVTGKIEPHATTVDERTPLRAAVDMLVGKKSLLYPDAYAIVHQRFGVTSIDQLSLEQIPQAVEYVHKLVLEGEVLPAETDKPQYYYPLDRWLETNLPLRAAQRYQDKSKVVIPQKLLYGMDAKSSIRALLKELERDGNNVEACWREVEAMQHSLEVMCRKLRQIQCVSDDAINTDYRHVRREYLIE